MNNSIVTEHLIRLIVKQVNDNGLVVWYDPDGVYADAVKAMNLPNTTILRYEGSFFQLRWEIDQRHLMDGEEPPRLVVYVPMAQDQTHHALIELEAAGVVMQPGQQPPARNTRLAVVARNALKGILGEDVAAQVAKQTEAGKLTLVDLDALAAKGHEISKGVLTLVFGTGTPQEVALLFLAGDQYDQEIRTKGATGEFKNLLGKEFDFSPAKDADLQAMRLRLARHVLLTDLAEGLGQTLPSRLASVPVASTQAARASCVALAKAWRLRRDLRESYLTAARRVEKELALDAEEFDPRAITSLETFAILEKALLKYAENRLLEITDADMVLLAESRMAGFWCDAEPRFQARWALVAAAARVLLEAQRIEKALKKAPHSMTGMIEQYAMGSDRYALGGRQYAVDSGEKSEDSADRPANPDHAPWCLLDTYHRHMEGLWYNVESHDEDGDGMEKLIIHARGRYAAVGSQVARRFLECVKEEGLPKGPCSPPCGMLRQRDIFEKFVKPVLGKEKVAYVWVDALRFEMGRELARLLSEDFKVQLHPALAAVPTVTEIGMAALLPGAHENAKVVTLGSGKLALQINGTIIKDRKDRVAFLKKHAGVDVFDTKLDNLLPKPSKKVREGIESARLVLVTSQEIDELCEQDNISQARKHMDGILNDLRRGIRILCDMGMEQIVLAADHGHLFAEELSEDMKVESPGGVTADLHRRVWLGHGGHADDAFLRLPLSALGMQSDDLDLATPWTFACFKVKGGAKAYFHGGLSLQEVLVPAIVVRRPTKRSVGPPRGIQWTLEPGSQKLTTRFFSVQITGVLLGLFELTPPKIRVELRAKGKSVSRAVSASYGFQEATGDVVLRSDTSNARLIAPNTITLMVTEELDEKSVGLHVLDAATGAELARLEKIDVAIVL